MNLPLLRRTTSLSPRRRASLNRIHNDGHKSGVSSTASIVPQSGLRLGLQEIPLGCVNMGDCFEVLMEGKRGRGGMGGRFGFRLAV